MLTRTLKEVPLLIVALSMAAGLTACQATKQVSMNRDPVQGFLPNPALLQKGTSGQLDQVYIRPNTNWGTYTKMYLEPVTIWAAPGSDLDRIPIQQQKALANAFYSALHAAAATRCQMVTEPSAGTMVWRIALVDATSVNPVLNTISTYEPHVRTLDMLAGYAFNHGVAYGVGRATAEGYAKDATTGELLWQGLDERAGTKALGTDTINAWSDVDNAFKAWANKVPQRLDELGACQGRRTS